MTCSAVFERFEQHEGLHYRKQLEEYCMGVPPAALGVLGSTVVVMRILLYIWGVDDIFKVTIMVVVDLQGC